MKYQSTKHKELWDKIIAQLESVDFSKCFKPLYMIELDYCIAMGLSGYCPIESCAVHKCGTDCLYMKVVHAYINHDKVNAIKYAKLIRDILAKEGVEIE